ncbi:MAG: glutamate racemase [Deltaproteobacteria bacterium]|nr:glutamate racemase [Deltaproteobacteria bacterium]MCL5276173.1 glutamate racemase [Deltaproteobacteria bacterium]
MRNKGIGIFDSGVGGLTVLKEIRKLLPEEDIFYLGDTARVPYGNRSRDTIVNYSIQNTGFLIKQGIKLLVVACNTSSSVALETLRRTFTGLPIIGVIEPGSEQAVHMTTNMRIGVIGTRATITSDSYRTAINLLDNGVKVFQQACPLFVPIVEEGMHRTALAGDVAEYYLAPLKRHGIDTIILGCTHYPALSPIIKTVMGSRVTLINSGQAVAIKTYEYLSGHDLLKDGVQGPDARGRSPVRGHMRFFVTDDPPQFKKIGRLLLSREIDSNVRKVVLEDHE